MLTLQHQDHKRHMGGKGARCGIRSAICKAQRWERPSYVLCEIHRQQEICHLETWSGVTLLIACIVMTMAIVC